MTGNFKSAKVKAIGQIDRRDAGIP